MELTVLGKSPAWQDSGGACSSYLVREQGFALLLDCGSGAFGKLRLVLDYRSVGAVLITHTHPDHVLDLVPYAMALSYSPRRHAEGPPSVLPLHVPAGQASVLRAVAAAFGDPEMFDRVFQLREYDPAEELELGPLRARFREVPHFVTAYAVALAAPGARLVFSADCGPNDELERFAAGAEVLLIEATSTPEETGGTFRGHLTPREAGELARRAGVKRLILTHFSDEVNAALVRAGASEAFGGEVELAAELAGYVI